MSVRRRGVHAEVHPVIETVVLFGVLFKHDVYFCGSPDTLMSLACP